LASKLKTVDSLYCLAAVFTKINSTLLSSAAIERLFSAAGSYFPTLRVLI